MASQQVFPNPASPALAWGFRDCALTVNAEDEARLVPCPLLQGGEEVFGCVCADRKSRGEVVIRYIQTIKGRFAMIRHEVRGVGKAV